jgi:hypothetical protein
MRKILSNSLQYSLLFIILMILVVGCEFTGPEPPNVSPTKPITKTSTKTITYTPSQINTFTKVLSPTLKMTNTVITDTPLSDSQIQENVLTALKPNDNCRLSCWWGIVPGVTSWSEANSTLQEIGLKPAFDNISGKYLLLYEFSGDNHALIFWMDFKVQSNLVKTIIFRTEGYTNLPSFKNVYANLSPEKIMDAYGTPSEVDMTGGFGSGGVFYVISFYYNDLGFAISYDGKAPVTSINSTTAPFCPTFGEKGNLTGGLGVEFVANDMIVEHGTLGHTLREAAGISPQELHDLYINNKNDVCFDTPADLWK